MRVALALTCLLGCPSGEPATPTVDPLALRVATFNTGTTEGLDFDEGEGAYTEELAGISDEHYGDGLAWLPAVDAARAWLEQAQPDLVGFQEVFDPRNCPEIPVEAHPHFVCERWQEGDPTVAQEVLGEGWQVACHPGKDDKCLAVRRDFGTFAGCEGDLCDDALTGFPVDGCGSGARVVHGTVETRAGLRLRVGHMHGSSGVNISDQDCRVAQLDALFGDFAGLGPFEPSDVATERVVLLGDFNTDPVRAEPFDRSARRFAELAETDADAWPSERGFRFHTETDEDSEPTYAGVFSIDHVLSTGAQSEPCVHPGLDDGSEPVIEATYFDHRPALCALEFPGGELE